MSTNSSKADNNEKSSNIKWVITVLISTFILSILFSFISTYSINNLNVIPAIIILFLVILIGIIFDIIAVAVTVGDERDFHAKASKKIRGSRSSIKLIRNSAKVANVCADVIGDICGVLSGAISSMIALKITSELSLELNLQFLISALGASLTVSGKALGKVIAQKNSTQIIHFVGKITSMFSRDK